LWSSLRSRLPILLERIESQQYRSPADPRRSLLCGRARFLEHGAARIVRIAPGDGDIISCTLRRTDYS